MDEEDTASSGERLERDGEAAEVNGACCMAEEESSEGEEGGGGETKGPKDHIKVKVLDYEKIGEEFSYTVQVVVNDGKPLLLHHNYSNIKWLYRLLARRVDLGGNILPPLPEAPAALLPHQETLGAPQSSMFGGYSRLACLEVETFLQSLADHPFFSEHHDVHTCLTAVMSPHDTIGAASLWTSLTSAYFNHQLTTIQDTDEEFVETLKTVNECIPVVEACSRDFNHMATAWQRVACAEVTVCECVKEEGEWEVGRNDACAISLTSLSNVLNEHQKYNHSASTDAQNTIGFTFDLQHRYSKQAKDMLYRRLDKVQVLINASKQLDKAKPEKKEAAELARAAAMTSYKTITDTAKAEVARLAHTSALALRTSLVNLAECQVTHSRCFLAQLASLHSQLSIS